MNTTTNRVLQPSVMRAITKLLTIITTTDTHSLRVVEATKYIATIDLIATPALLQYKNIVSNLNDYRDTV